MPYYVSGAKMNQKQPLPGVHRRGNTTPLCSERHRKTEVPGLSAWWSSEALKCILPAHHQDMWQHGTSHPSLGQWNGAEDTNFANVWFTSPWFISSMLSSQGGIGVPPSAWSPLTDNVCEQEIKPCCYKPLRFEVYHHSINLTSPGWSTLWSDEDERFLGGFSFPLVPRLFPTHITLAPGCFFLLTLKHLPAWKLSSPPQHLTLFRLTNDPWMKGK